MLKSKGFSLIELMIAIVIAGILMSVALPAFREWAGNAQIKSASESLLDGLSLARATAVNTNTDTSFFLTGNGWSVTSSGVSVVIQSHSNMDGSKNAAISSATPTVMFNGAGRVVTPLPAGGVSVFSISYPSMGACSSIIRCMNVTLSVGGQMRMCNPSFSRASNPQGC